MNASSFVYIDVVIICTMMSFYQQILHSFSCCNVLCIGNLTYAGHFAVCPSMSPNEVFGDIMVLALPPDNVNALTLRGLAQLCSQPNDTRIPQIFKMQYLHKK